MPKKKKKIINSEWFYHLYQWDKWPTEVACLTDFLSWHTTSRQMLLWSDFVLSLYHIYLTWPIAIWVLPSYSNCMSVVNFNINKTNNHLPPQNIELWKDHDLFSHLEHSERLQLRVCMLKQINEPSLENRCIKLGMQYATKLKVYPSNPTNDCVFNPLLYCLW